MRRLTSSRLAAVAATTLSLAALSSACVSTNYVREDRAGDAASPAAWPARRVVYHLDRRLLDAPPECVVVLPPPPGRAPDLAAVIEPALERHLARKTARVLLAGEARRLVRELALDPGDAGDLRHLVRVARCPAVLSWRVVEAVDLYLGVWSERRLELEVTLRDAVDDSPLWRARHAAVRADGGLPLSPLAVPLAVADATLHHADGELRASLVDDVARRLFATLPSLR